VEKGMKGRKKKISWEEENERTNTQTNKNGAFSTATIVLSLLHGF
jgi:hypothetical protein